MGVFCDSYMGYATADIDKKWTGHTGFPAILPTGGRESRGAVQLAGSSIIKTLLADATWVVGTAFKFTPLIQSPILRYTDAGTSQIEISVLADGTLQAVRGPGGTVLATSTFALNINTWYFIESKVVVDNAAGSVEIRVNGTTRLSVAGTDTQHTANPTANGVILSGTTGVGTSYLFADTLIRWGADAASFLDDKVVKAFFPDGDGFWGDWPPSVAGPHYSMVNEATPDFADYVESVTATNRDSYTFEDLNDPTASVYAVQLAVAAEKDDGGVREIELFTRVSGTDYDSGAVEAVSVSPLYYHYVWTTNPDTGLPWTPAEIDAFEAGQELVT